MFRNNTYSDRILIQTVKSKFFCLQIRQVTELKLMIMEVALLRWLYGDFATYRFVGAEAILFFFFFAVCTQIKSRWFIKRNTVIGKTGHKWKAAETWNPRFPPDFCIWNPFVRPTRSLVKRHVKLRTRLKVIQWDNSAFIYTWIHFLSQNFVYHHCKWVTVFYCDIWLSTRRITCHLLIHEAVILLLYCKLHVKIRRKPEQVRLCEWNKISALFCWNG